jgi:hypothetical protein
MCVIAVNISYHVDEPAHAMAINRKAISPKPFQLNRRIEMRVERLTVSKARL